MHDSSFIIFFKFFYKFSISSSIFKTISIFISLIFLLIYIFSYKISLIDCKKILKANYVEREPNQKLETPPHAITGDCGMNLKWIDEKGLWADTSARKTTFMRVTFRVRNHNK